MTLRTLSRTSWALLGVGHTAAIPSLLLPFATASIPSFDVGSHLVRLIGLIAAVAFCALKTIDVPWLRIRPGWKPAIASIIVVAMLHTNVLARETGVEAAESPLPIGAAVISTLLFEPEAIRRALHELKSRSQTRDSVNPTPGFSPICSVCIDLHFLRSAVRGVLCQVPRPPPSC